MKIALIGDTHWGIRKGSEVFANHQVQFVEERVRSRQLAAEQPVAAAIQLRKASF